jgi:iron complex outermembrane recepter protein
MPNDEIIKRLVEVLVRTIALSVLLAFFAAATPLGAQAKIQQFNLNIPRQQLDGALSELSRVTGLQIARMSDEGPAIGNVGPLRGEFDTNDALKTLLQGTGLKYEFVSDRLVKVYSAQDAAKPNKTADDGSKSAEGSLWDRFRIAQAEQGAGVSSTALGNSTQGNEREDANLRQLEEVTVTAQKREERLQDVPISISVLGGKDLDNSTFSGVTDALNTVPGVAAFASQNQQGGTTLAIRGVSASNGGFVGGASTVADYIDGVPFGMVRSALVPDLNIYDLNRIEVLRGPQGTLYGANALVGVVRVLTNDPDLNNFDFKTQGVVSTTEGGGENYSGNAAANLPIVEGKLAARAVFGEDRESGWISGPVGTHVNSADLNNVRLKVSAQPTDSLSVGLSAWHSQSDYDAPNQSDANYQITAQHPQPMDTHFNAFGASVGYQLSLVSVSSMTSYVDYVNDNLLDIGPAGLPEYLQTNLASRVFSEELNLTSKLDGPWRWSAGVFYRADKDEYLQDLMPYANGADTLFDNFEDTSKSEAVYGELSRRVLDNKVEWTLGARYFHDAEGTQAIGALPGLNVPLNKVTATSSATTPRAVVRWFPSETLTAYASFSQGFRSGTPQDELVAAVVPNFPALKPDKLTSYEVGGKGALWDQRVSYEADVFYMDWKEIQQELNVPDPLVPGSTVAALVNGAKASGEGAEFDVTTRPVSGLTVSVNFGWNNLHFDSTVYSGGTILFPEGARPNDSPEYTAGVSAKYAVPLGGGLRGVFSASGNYISPLNTFGLNALNTGPNASQIANSLLLTRGTFDLEFPQHWTVGLFVDNANNWNGTQGGGYPGRIPQFEPRIRPRTCGVRFDYHFQ